MNILIKTKNEEEDEKIEKAATKERRTKTNFVLKAALDRAEEVLTNV